MLGDFAPYWLLSIGIVKTLNYGTTRKSILLKPN